MRLSKRERFLLAVLTLLLLWTGFYKFWIEPETDLLFANLQEINRLEEQIKRGGPQGKQNLEQTAEKLEQAGNGQIYFADMSPEKMEYGYNLLKIQKHNPFGDLQMVSE